MSSMSRREQIHREIQKELQFAYAKFSSFNSLHEGWAVIYEEVDELWEEVRRHRQARSKVHMRKECIQIAAMAIRFVEDLLGEVDD